MLRLFQYISPIKFYTNQNHLINVKQNFHFPIFARVLLFTVVISLFSCEKDELDFSTPDMEQAKMSNSSTDFRRKIENPYTVQNMQMALDSVIHRMERGKLKSSFRMPFFPNTYTQKFIQRLIFALITFKNS